MLILGEPSLKYFTKIYFILLFILARLDLISGIGGSVTQEELEINVKFLLSTDTRLIRYDATRETSQRQRSKTCDDGLFKSIDALVSPEPLLQNLAAQHITLCITDNPTNRQKFFDNGGTKSFESLIQMISTPETSAAACEAIWIASFNNQQNQKMFVKFGVIPALSQLITQKKETYSFDAIMWACAAIQNLAANYCHSDSGHCFYDWDTNQGNEPFLTLLEETPININNEEIRLEFIKFPGLIEKLIDLTCSGPVSQKHSKEYIWPSRAERNHGSISGSIIPWASAGALRNLILSNKYPRETTEMEDVMCLCSLLYSPDWLEYAKADDAIFRLGLSEESCPLPYAESCEDIPHWKNERGDGCDVYFEQSLCVEFGDLRNTEGTMNAFDACCICGGGIVEAGMVDEFEEEF